MGYGNITDKGYPEFRALKQALRTRTDVHVKYVDAQLADVNTEINCPVCKRRFVKSHRAQVFCSNKGKFNCKDAYWQTLRRHRMIDKIKLELSKRRDRSK